MAQIIWTVRAADDLEEIAEYIAADKPDAATNFVKKVIESIEQLVDFPAQGRIVPEFKSEHYRELIVAPCRIIYTPASDAVIILRIIRGERQLHLGMLSRN
jgi:plasmid stabilization system protein ParE